MEKIIMKKIRLMLEYKAYPIWIYDEDGFVDDNALPEQWKNSLELVNSTEEIQSIFDSLYMDTVNEFKYIGFLDKEQRIVFIEKINYFIKLVKEINNDEFIIQNDIDISNL
jgi:hypothetical protein